MSANKPIVYGCAGCSSAGQLANHLAVRLDREGLAEMSCIVGVGGDVTSLVNKAVKSENIIAIDGCPLHCVLHTLRLKNIEPSMHIDLNKMDVKKEFHKDYSGEDADRVYEEISKEIAEREK